MLNPHLLLACFAGTFHAQHETVNFYIGPYSNTCISHAQYFSYLPTQTS